MSDFDNSESRVTDGDRVQPGADVADPDVVADVNADRAEDNWNPEDVDGEAVADANPDEFQVEGAEPAEDVADADAVDETVGLGHDESVPDPTEVDDGSPLEGAEDPSSEQPADDVPAKHRSAGREPDEDRVLTAAENPGPTTYGVISVAEVQRSIEEAERNSSTDSVGRQDHDPKVSTIGAQAQPVPVSAPNESVAAAQVRPWQAERWGAHGLEPVEGDNPIAARFRGELDADENGNVPVSSTPENPVDGVVDGAYRDTDKPEGR